MGSLVVKVRTKKIVRYYKDSMDKDSSFGQQFYTASLITLNTIQSCPRESIVQLPDVVVPIISPGIQNKWTETMQLCKTSSLLP